MADGKVVIDVILDDGRVVKGVANIDGQFKRVGDSAKRSAASIGSIVKALGLVALASKGISMINNSLDGAISRYDTLNNFPRVLQRMGFDAEESQGAIDRLSEGIDGLPTTLDSVASTTQRLALMTGDLDGAVDTTLALNNAFLASGASAADAERGLEQYVQMLSKGEVDLESWRTLQETMPIALNKTAEAFGFTGASAQNDLYDALKEGDVTFDQFNKKIIELSNETGGFADIAREASGGIRTAWTNMNTAIVKGVADVIGAIDDFLGNTSVGSIEGIFDKMKTGIQTVFRWIVSMVPVVGGKIIEFKSKLEEWSPVIDRIKSAFGPFVDTIRGAYQNLFASIGPIWESLKTLFSSLQPVLSILGGAFMILYGIMTSTWSALVAALGPVINAVINFVNVILNVFNSVIALLTGDFSGALEFWKQATQSSIEFIKNLWNGIVSFFAQFITSIIDFFYGLYMALVGNSIIPDMVNAIIDWFKKMFSFLVNIVKNIVNGVKSGFDSMQKIVSSIVKAIQKVIKSGFNAARSIVTTVINTIRNVITSGFNAARSIVTTVINAIRSIISSGFNAARSIITSVVNRIRSAISSGFNAARSIVSSVVNSIRSVVSSIFNSLAGIVRGAMSRVGSAIGSGMRSALRAVTSVARSFYNAGRNIVTSIANGIKGAIGKVTGAISSVTSRIRNFLPFSPAKEGALRDIMKVRISESIGEAIEKGSPKAIKSMRALTDNLSHEIQPETGFVNRLRGIKAPLGNIMPINYERIQASHSDDQKRTADAAGSKEKPAVITLVLGGREYSAFVEDITEHQERTRLTLEAFRG